MRVLITIAPTMYWETLELTLLRYRPQVDVRIANPADLDQEVAAFEPQVVVCNEVTPAVRENVPSWVEVPPSHSSDATIHILGQGESTIGDISSGDLFDVIDRTEEALSSARYFDA